MPRFKLISEKNYMNQMNTRVIPSLKPYHTGGTVERIGGQPVRWDYSRCPNARGSIMIPHGFTESGYKFIEMVYYFHKMGLNVCTVAHRGHGRSWRGVDEVSLTDADDFYDYVLDLRQVTLDVLQKKGDGPYLIYGHSMGGAIEAVLLKRFPDLYSAATFNAPMIRAQTGGLPLALTGLIAKIAVRLGWGQKPVFVHRLYDPEESFEESPATSKARFEWYSDMRRRNPFYRNNAATYKWLRETVKVCTELTGKYGTRGIRIPTVFYIAQQDTFVDSGAIRTFASKIPHARIVQIPASKHEIYRSGNDALEVYLNSIEAFIDENIDASESETQRSD